MDYTLHGILQARILEWVAIPFSRGSSQPRDWTQVSRIVGRFFPNWTMRGAHNILNDTVIYIDGLWKSKLKNEKEHLPHLLTFL